jgi:putative salt-induced outer membrane protein
MQKLVISAVALASATAVLGSATGAQAAPIPDAVAAMIDAAAGDADQLKVVADIARKTNPQSVAEIDAKLAGIEKAQAAAREEKLASQGFFEGWSGSGEAGGFVSSGNTDTQGIAIGVNVAKETRKWKHALRGFVDYQRQDDVTTRERYFAGYEGNYNITPNLYALATLSWERDPFSGFNRRFAQSLGLGYKIINNDSVKLSVEGGPALRQTRFTNGIDDNAFAARAAGNFEWQINEGLQFTQSGLLFYDSFNTSTQAISALTAKLSGALSARASFQFNSESNPPAGRENTDTVSRVTIVYSF